MTRILPMSENNNRRSFLRNAAILTASAAIIPSLSACDDGAAQSESGTSGASSAAAKAADAKLIATAAELEAEAIKVYTVAAGLPFISEDEIVLGVAGRFMAQHKEHLARLNALVGALGGKPIDPEAVKVREIPEDITDERKPPQARKIAVIRFARELEMSAAQAYFQFVTARLQTPEARTVVADIMPVEAQHVALYDTFLEDQTPSAAAFLTAQKG